MERTKNSPADEFNESPSRVTRSAAASRAQSVPHMNTAVTDRHCHFTNP